MEDLKRSKENISTTPEAAPETTAQVNKSVPPPAREPAHEESAPKRQKNNRFESNRKYFSICIYAIITFCICLLIFKFTNNWSATMARINGIFSMLTPFLLAFLIAYFINPLIRTLDRLLFRKQTGGRFYRLHKLVSLILAYLIVIGFILLILTFVVPQIGDSIIELIRQAPTLFENAQDGINEFIADHPTLDLAYINEKILPNVFDTVQKIMSGVLPMVYSAGLSVINWLINIILAFVISCYLMWDKTRLLLSIKRLVYTFFSEKTAGKMIEIVKKSNDIFSAYIIGKALDSLIIGVLCFILMVVLRLPYALLISLIVGITNMIPYFGPFVGAIPGALLLLIISPRQALIFVIMVFLLQQFDGNILGPKILGDKTGLQPIWIIFAITVGGYTSGVLGMFLGVPVVAVLAYLLDLLVKFILKKRRLSPEVNEMLEYDKPQEAANK